MYFYWEANFEFRVYWLGRFLGLVSYLKGGSDALIERIIVDLESGLSNGATWLRRVVRGEAIDFWTLRAESIAGDLAMRETGFTTRELN